jgi:hypothetical protein
MRMIENAIRKLIGGLGKPLPIAVPVTLLLLLAAGGSIAVIAGVGLPGQPSALAAQCTFSVFSGSAEVQVPGSDQWQEATDGMVLAVGARVRTSPDSHAMLTFFEGSSLKLEPGTDVEINRVDGEVRGPTDIVLTQWVGKTWNRVVKKLDARTHYEIQTPSAHALVRGTLFEVEVDEALATSVRTIEGLVSVIAEDEEVFLPAGQETSVDKGAPPSEPRPITPSANELVVTVGWPAVASLCDPTGSSAGYLPDGSTLSQIARARSTSPHQGDQTIRIPDPAPGEYALVLRGVGDGTTQLSIDALSGGRPVLAHAASPTLTLGSEWLIRVNLIPEGRRIVAAEVSGIEPLDGRSPSSLVSPFGTVTPTPVSDSTPQPTEPEPTEPEPSELNYTLTIVSSNGGSVTQPGQGVFLIRAGSVITLVAKADAGWTFDHWEGAVEDTSSSTTAVEISKCLAVTAIFTRQN